MLVFSLARSHLGFVLTESYWFLDMVWCALPGSLSFFLVFHFIISSWLLSLQKPGEQSHGNLRLFSSNELEIATQNFSSSNKIGEGGFGCVYKVKDSFFCFHINYSPPPSLFWVMLMWHFLFNFEGLVGGWFCSGCEGSFSWSWIYAWRERIHIWDSCTVWYQTWKSGYTSRMLCWWGQKISGLWLHGEQQPRTYFTR